MRPRTTWAVQSFLTCFIVNALLLAVFTMMARQILDGLNQWVDPFLQPGAQNIPPDVRSSVSHLKEFLDESRRYLEPVVLGGGGAVTLILWLLLHLQGRGLARKVQQAAGATLSVRDAAPGDAVKDARLREAHAPVPSIQPISSPQPAIQLLALLQRQGRLIDFLQEDLTLYEDGQIGAAVRSIHQGCRDVLREHMELKPIFQEAEGTQVNVPSDFDPRSIRLTGNVSGDPPFSGVLRHRGWRVEHVELPQATTEQKKDWVVAPAEVEMEG